MNQFQVQMLKHLRDTKKQQLRNPYDSSFSQQAANERKRSNTQTSCNSNSTNPFTQIESSTQYDPKALGLPEVDYIPELSRESSSVKKRRTVELDPTRMEQLITPARVNVLLVESDTTNQRSLSTDYSSVKKNGTEEKKVPQSLNQLRERMLLQSDNLNTPNKMIDENGRVINKIMSYESFYNFPILYDKEERESRRRSREYSDVVQERNEIRRNRSLSANQQKYMHAILENGKKDYKRVKRIYSSSQSRLRFTSDKESYSKDVYVKVYDDCKKNCKDFDSLIRSSTSLTKSSTMQSTLTASRPTFPSYVKQTEVQLKQLNKEFKNKYCNIMNEIHTNQSQQRLDINNKFFEFEESMRFSKTINFDSSPFLNSTNQKPTLDSSNYKQDNHLLNSQEYQNAVNVSSFQGNNQLSANTQNNNYYDSTPDNNNNERQRILSQTKLQSSLNLNINSPEIMNTGNFEILNSYSTKSQKPCQGSQGVKPLIYSAEKYVSQCNNLMKLESDLKQYRQAQQNNSSQAQQFLQQPQLQQQQLNMQQSQKSLKKVSKKEYLASKCRHNLTTMYCSICNRQVKSKF